jgi:hypothetical protein
MGTANVPCPGSGVQRRGHGGLLEIGVRTKQRPDPDEVWWETTDSSVSSFGETQPPPDSRLRISVWWTRRGKPQNDGVLNQEAQNKVTGLDMAAGAVPWGGDAEMPGRRQMLTSDSRDETIQAMGPCRHVWQARSKVSHPSRRPG